MAKPRTPNQKKRYAALNKRLAKYVALVQGIYDSLSLEAATIVTTLTDYSPDTEQPFRFKDYPLTKTRVNDLMRYFSHDIQALIYAGTTDEWAQSNLVQDLLANDVLKVYGMRRGDERVKRYYQPNNDALQAFQQRKDKGFTVSQKVWNQSYNFKRELEYAISSGIERGQSAITLSKRISKYLHDFPSLQADYKERYGTATECQDCEYRSVRLARSEINMAYRTAEQTRWQQMDFIKGYEIKLSHSHPRPDVCDELAGIYPKWFKWTGWHPNDMCYVVPIVMTDDEWYSGKGEVIDKMPDNFNGWVLSNVERIDGAAERNTLPYFIKDNLKYINDLRTEYNCDADSIRTTEAGHGGKMGESKGRFVDIDIEEVRKNLQALSNANEHEEVYVLLSDGRVYHKVGIGDRVNFSDEEKAMFAGGVLLHNHYHEPLSPQDIAFAYRYRLKESHALAVDNEYIVFAPEERGKDYTKNEIIYGLGLQAEEIFDSKRKKANSIVADRMTATMPTHLMRELCSLLGMECKIIPFEK